MTGKKYNPFKKTLSKIFAISSIIFEDTRTKIEKFLVRGTPLGLYFSCSLTSKIGKKSDVLKNFKNDTLKYVKKSLLHTISKKKSKFWNLRHTFKIIFFLFLSLSNA